MNGVDGNVPGSDHLTQLQGDHEQSSLATAVRLNAIKAPELIQIVQVESLLAQ
ncbi:hypothetical protein [Deinococcus piscis]|uniref:hypothetical protein n=1 Tax=Deinococcus piscis TaxID=394230 RepID=UPI00167971AD|nr:hypothetical protein [Deinococcus piscis]